MFPKMKKLEKGTKSRKNIAMHVHISWKLQWMPPQKAVEVAAGFVDFALFSTLQWTHPEEKDIMALRCRKEVYLLALRNKL